VLFFPSSRFSPFFLPLFFFFTRILHLGTSISLRTLSCPSRCPAAPSTLFLSPLPFPFFFLSFVRWMALRTGSGCWPLSCSFSFFFPLFLPPPPPPPPPFFFPFFSYGKKWLASGAKRLALPGRDSARLCLAPYTPPSFSSFSSFFFLFKGLEAAIRKT